MKEETLYFSPEIAWVEKRIQESLTSASALAREVFAYVFDGGKHLRPRLIVLAGRAREPFTRQPLAEDANLLTLAAAVEILHTASLLHDDVIDEADTRRGKPSVAQRFGRETAILTADMLFAQAFEMAIAASASSEPLQVLCRASRTMCESELYQIEHRHQFWSEEDYLHIIGSKTAALFGACAELGALMGREKPDLLGHFRDFGFYLGMAFQIADDALDYSARHDKWGKPLGNDLSQGKITLPLVHVLDQAQKTDREELVHELRNGRRLDKVLPLIEKYGGLEYSWQQARHYSGKARESLEALHPIVARDAWEGFCNLALNRAY